MKKISGSEVIFDLENIVYSAWNYNKERKLKGQIDYAFHFPPSLLAQAIVEHIETRLNAFDMGVLFTSAITTGKSRRLANCVKIGFIETLDCYGKLGRAGDQLADRRIREILADIYHLWAHVLGLVLVSGDGGFIDVIDTKVREGFRCVVVSWSWSLNNGYYSVLGEDDILVLTERDLDQIMWKVKRGLPRA